MKKDLHGQETPIPTKIDENTTVTTVCDTIIAIVIEDDIVNAMTVRGNDVTVDHVRDT
jgi:hypothetical protein